MTEKRFTYNVNKNTIECDGKFVAYVNCADGSRIANKLSTLSNENERLKLDNTNLHRAMSRDRVNYLEFRDKVFELIDEKIEKGEEAIEWGKSMDADYGAMGFHVEMLKLLKKELQE